MVCAPVRRDNPQALARGLSTMLYLTRTIISSMDLAHCGVSCAKDCGLWYNFFWNKDSN